MDFIFQGDLKGTITFLIIPRMADDSIGEIEVKSPEQPLQVKKMNLHLRALFTYKPEEDLYIPCKELGLSFIKGDILHVTSQDDPDWWQAFRDGDKQSLAGLIPSQSFQERFAFY